LKKGGLNDTENIMKWFVVAMLLASVSFAHAKDAEDAKRHRLGPCVDDGEKAAVATKDCAGFKKVMACRAELEQYFKTEVDKASGELARLKSEGVPNAPGVRYNHSYAERKSLMEQSVDEMTQAVAQSEKSVTIMQNIGKRVQQEQHDAACEGVQ
jgi:hypothetical protein